MSNRFFRDSELDFQTRGLLGRSVRGASEVGEVLATISRIRRREDWAEQWRVTALAAEAEAEHCRGSSNSRSVAAHSLRAATYWGAVVDGLSTSSDQAPLLEAFRRHRQSWESFIAASDGSHLAVDVDYEGSSLPGYLLRPDSSGESRPTLVVTNGSDGSLADLWTAAIAGALARGWNTFVYDGPGQQSMLFERRTSFRPDWEAVLTPVVDTLVQRDDVDPARLTGYGISQAGYWLTRALAHEHRLVAAVVDPGLVDVSDSWTRPLSKGLRRMLVEGDQAGFNKNMAWATKIPSVRRTLTSRSRPYGDHHDDWFGLYREVAEYTVDQSTADQIRTPLLITDPEDEQFWPGQPQRLAAMLPGVHELATFSASDGASGHCQPTGRLLTELRMFDWLEARLCDASSG